jgi:hypothetical protein
MTIRNLTKFERIVDRVAPAILLVLGVSLAGATALLGV